MYERPLAYVCSPIKGDASARLHQDKQYARKVFDAGYEPFLPHLFYSVFLENNIVDERKAGTQMGLNHLKKCRILIVCSKEKTDSMLTESTKLNDFPSQLSIWTALKTINQPARKSVT